MKKNIAIAATLAGLMSSHGEILVSEDFDYDQASVTSGTLDGGTGFAAESTWGMTGNGLATAYIFDGTPDETPLAGETWDGVFNGLTSSATHLGRNATNGQHLYITRALDTAAMGPHLADGQVLWMSWVAHGGSNGNRRTGMVLSSGPALRERAQSLDGAAGPEQFPAQAAGATTYHTAPSVYSTAMHPVVFEQPTTAITTQINGGPINNSGSLTDGDHLMIVKFEWNADNAEPDTISLYNLSEPPPETTDLSTVITEEDFDANKMMLTHVLNQTEFDTLAGMTVHGLALFDQIRIGTTFNDVIGVVPDAPFPFTITRNPPNLDFTWTSQPGMLYRLRSSADLSTAFSTWDLVAEDLPPTPPTGTYSIAQPADPRLFFRMEEYLAPPVTLFAEDFEGITGLPAGWVAGKNDPPDSASLTNWEVGTPANVGPIPPGIPLPSGTQCVATDIDGNYDEAGIPNAAAFTDIFLRTPEIDLTGYTEANLGFQQWTEIEQVPGVDLDYGSIRILDAADDSELAVLADRTIDGNTTTWKGYSKPLPAEAFTASTGKIKIEFRFEADDFSSFPGWYIDDVTVTAPAP